MGGERLGIGWGLQIMCSKPGHSWQRPFFCIPFSYKMGFYVFYDKTCLVGCFYWKQIIFITKRPDPGGPQKVGPCLIELVKPIYHDRSQRNKLTRSIWNLFLNGLWVDTQFGLRCGVRKKVIWNRNWCLVICFSSSTRAFLDGSSNIDADWKVSVTGNNMIGLQWQEVPKYVKKYKQLSVVSDSRHPNKIGIALICI